jgi:hypothetical protein
MNINTTDRSGTVSESVSESAEIGMKSSGKLGRILIDLPMKTAILLALNRLVQCNPDNWLHLHKCAFLFWDDS